VQLTIDHNRETLKHGAVLIDEDDLGETPRLLVAMTQSMVDGHDPARTISKRFDFVEITPDGTTGGAGQAPYLDYVPSSAELRSILADAPGQAWAHRDPESEALNWRSQTLYPSTNVRSVDK
jgi:hypothetical protein